MRKLLLTAAVMICTLGAATPAGAATTRTVTIYGSTITPSTITITQEDTIVWRNGDNENHQVLASHGEFVSPILKPHQTYTFTFHAAGTYHYSDELHPKLKGTIVVKGLPPTLSFAVSAPSATYGQHVTVSGVVSNHAAGEPVVIWYQPYGQVSPIQQATVLTVAGGLYSLDVAPGIQTTYEAQWKGAFSTPSTVRVAPKITIGRDNGWIVHVAGGRTFAGRAVQLQRLNAVTGQWVTLQKGLLNARSSVKLIAKLPLGMNHIRVAFSVNQAGAGFLGALSSVVNWRVS